MPNTQDNKMFPACFVEFPNGVEGRSATFFLAAEEYVASHFDLSQPNQAYLYTWQLAPTVVMGRNQVAHQEVDLDFCERESIDVVRRKSGGGAIFADERNIMTSLIATGGAVEPLFQAYAQAVSGALNALGATTAVSGRNDIVLTTPTTTGKICGNAFYHQAGANIVHGTMLYDTDPRKMHGALHPDESKLQASGVKSVRARVALLKDVLSFGVAELRVKLRELLTDRCVQLTEDDVLAIEALEREYRTPEFLYGRKADYNTIIRQRINGVGTLEFKITLHNGKVETLALTGDFFEEGSAENAFCEAFVGYVFSPTVIRERIMAVCPERTVRNLTRENLLALLIDPNEPR